MLRNNYITIYWTRLRPFVLSLRYKHRQKAGLLTGVLLAIVIFGFFAAGVQQPSTDYTVFVNSTECNRSPVVKRYAVNLTKTAIASLFDENFFYNPSPPVVFDKNTGDGPVTVFTTINPSIQKNLIGLFNRYSPLLAAGVVIDATTGAVLAMGNHTGNMQNETVLPGATGNYCLSARFPAASLIKIVTAAAVLERKGFDSVKSLPVSGQYYTLYKHQLGLKRARYRSKPITLEKAFSKSINPFFGKLGIHYLTEKEFDEVAEAFLFNVPVDFDMPLGKSNTFDPDTQFERAELACGFNTRTTISPLHAALIAALPVTEGKIMKPYLVEKIIGFDNQDVYTAGPETLSKPLSSSSVKGLYRLMQATIRKGTARKSFSHLKKSRHYGGWSLGGKTGAINLPGCQRRCEWFAGFAENGDTKLAISLVVVHGDLRKVRPSFVAAEIFRGCFEQQPVKTAALRSSGKDVSTF